MMTATATLNVRIPSALKVEAARILDAAGLTLSDAIRMTLKRIVAERRLPFDPFAEVKIPNAETRAAIDELMAGGGQEYDSVEAMFEDFGISFDKNGSAHVDAEARA